MRDVWRERLCGAAQRGPNTRIVNLAGHPAPPGLIDGHTHPVPSARVPHCAREGTVEDEGGQNVQGPKRHAFPRANRQIFAVDELP
jgi:cytosine/adenosine deaminase-related metal-dependent hydrolase